MSSCLFFFNWPHMPRYAIIECMFKFSRYVSLANNKYSLLVSPSLNNWIVIKIIRRMWQILLLFIFYHFINLQLHASFYCLFKVTILHLFCTFIPIYFSYLISFQRLFCLSLNINVTKSFFPCITVYDIFIRIYAYREYEGRINVS